MQAGGKQEAIMMTLILYILVAVVNWSATGFFVYQGRILPAAMQCAVASYYFLLVVIYAAHRWHNLTKPPPLP